jgi:hypothetical protein
MDMREEARAKKTIRMPIRAGGPGIMIIKLYMP